MQYSFLGFSVSKMMELNLDMKDIAILRYFVDFKDTGRMHTEIVQGEKYYWINYRTMEEEMPYLALGKRAIMLRMLKLRDLGILIHHTKKEDGTFSFFALGDRYSELINNKENKSYKKEKEEESYKNVTNVQGYTHGVHKNYKGLCIKSHKGCVQECRTNTHLLNNSSTKETINIKKDISDIVGYLNSKLGTKYNYNSKNIFRLIMSKINDGYGFDDFKAVIDKKIKEWLGTEFEKYLTPSTLFGEKFEKYLNQNIVCRNNSSKKSYEASKLRFNNFKAREYDYDLLERQLLGWE